MIKALLSSETETKRVRRKRATNFSAPSTARRRRSTSSGRQQLSSFAGDGVLCYVERVTHAETGRGHDHATTQLLED
ncbi:hypothetical protein GWI33_001593 [Rhynchophorus ferrugineus]|uniref:Uncharacterized protein n=1 Tax=Rhynchophorus ferrugineus TaxID=354439 RepID=A0A834MI04_RHYFE|nr:hypothetical protein GWI33_001593 [Rhynchophorus ferrugineus]